MKFILASLKTLTYSKNSAVSRIKFLFCLSFAYIGRFCPVNIHSGFRNNIQDPRRVTEKLFKFQKAGTNSFKLVTGRHFTIIKGLS